MTGILILAVLALTIIAALEYGGRHSNTGSRRSDTSHRTRQIVKTKLDLLAAAGSSKPFTHKPLRTPRPRNTHRLAA